LQTFFANNNNLLARPIKDGLRRHGRRHQNLLAKEAYGVPIDMPSWKLRNDFFLLSSFFFFFISLLFFFCISLLFFFFISFFLLIFLYFFISFISCFLQTFFPFFISPLPLSSPQQKTTLKLFASVLLSEDQT
jgi:hypothetical protein